MFKDAITSFFIMRFHEIICQSEKNELNISAYLLNTMHNLHLMEQQTRELERLRPFKSPSHIIEFGTVRIVQDCPTASRFACSWTMLRYHDLLSLTITFTFETFD